MSFWLWKRKLCAPCHCKPRCTRKPLITSAIAKYLKTHADKRCFEASTAVQDNYAHILVIPAFDEPVDLLKKLLPPDARDILVILLINAPDNLESDSSEIKRTKSLLHTFAGSNVCPVLMDYDAKRHIDVLVIDFISTGNRVPHRKGVGAMRKLGADIALHLIDNQQVHTPWIFCSDADARLPNGYFQVSENFAKGNEECSAIVLPYRHFVDKKSDPDTGERSYLKSASILYELHMRYFINRLAWSGSPYAYPALGSLIVISANHYAMVRGFPSRPAAEDFYLLNKLAKIGAIACPLLPLVLLQARVSTRVPFGTGPALRKILDSGERLTYAPQSFNLLKLFYTELAQVNIVPGSMQQLWTGNFHNNPQAPMLIQILEKIGFTQFITQQLNHCKTPGRLLRSIHEWFDAFRILKFLHAARDFGLLDIPVLEALAETLVDISHDDRTRSHDYLAFLYSLEQSEPQHRGLGRYSEVLSP